MVLQLHVSWYCYEKYWVLFQLRYDNGLVCVYVIMGFELHYKIVLVVSMVSWRYRVCCIDYRQFSGLEYCESRIVELHWSAVVVSRRVLGSSLWVLHCLPLACGRRGSQREDEPLSCRSRVYFRRGCTLLLMLWMGLVCVPEGGVECDIHVQHSRGGRYDQK